MISMVYRGSCEWAKVHEYRVMSSKCWVSTGEGNGPGSFGGRVYIPLATPTVDATDCGKAFRMALLRNGDGKCEKR